MTLDAATFSARHSTRATHNASAGDGIAQSTTDNHRACGDPQPFDPANVVTQPAYLPPGQDDGQVPPALQGSAAVVTLSDPAISVTLPKEAVPDRGAAHTPPVARKRTRGGSTPSRSAKDEVSPGSPTPSVGDGHTMPEAQCRPAVATPSRRPKQAPTPIVAVTDEGDGQASVEAQSCSAVATLVDLWRQRVDLRRAEGRLHLQALAVCRRALNGDKDAAQKAWAKIQRGKSEDAAMALVVEPYRIAAATLDKSATALEREMAKRVRKLTIWTWAKDVRGLGELSVAGLIGESAGNPGDYRSVSALWKRFGLAVIEGQRQRRVADAEAALLHGYAPQRRAYAYVISTNLMKSQRAEDPYRQAYDRRKAYEMERGLPKAHAHNRALRYMVKALMRDLWAADRRLRA